MIKLSKLTDYAVVVLAQMAQDGARLSTASGLAERTTLPEPTVAKVLKLLAKGGVIASTRGVNGGYRLSDTPENISVARVVTALEGPVALTACCEEHHSNTECACTHAVGCPIRGQWNPLNEAMKGALESVSLAQMLNAGAQAR